MATAVAPRNDIYLAVLAGRALTALADLAADPSAWNERIRKDLESGVAYCQAVCLYEPKVTQSGSADVQQALRRLTTDENIRESSTRDLAPECQVVEALLRGLLAKSRRPQMSDFLAAIKFFNKRVGHEGL
jgi:hypothetical protein